MTSPIERLAVALADRYTILRELGAGGMATVYLAEDLKHDRKVALKVLKPELAAVLGAERFIVEIKTTAALQHPHILPLFDSGAADGFLYYVMPFIDGETLRDKLNRETQLGVEEAVRIATDVAEALDYAHQHGVIHRDIKPENILLANGRPMVADFGIALAVSAAAGGRMTETGLSLGTPHYMSPEQATAEKDISARSDVYSLASVLYEMLAGQPPHLGGSAQQIIMKIITETPADITTLRKSVPANVAAALAKALEKVPADRFASAKEFGAALSNATFLGAYSGARTGASRVTWKERTAIPLAVTTALLMGATIWALRRPAPSDAVLRTELTIADSARLTPQAGILFALNDDGKTLVYVGPGRGDIELYTRSLNSLASTQLAGARGADSPFLSPDGETVGFYTNNPRAFYTIGLHTGTKKTVVRDSTVALGGAFARDGSIYIVRNEGIRRTHADGGAVEEITRVDHANGETAHAWVDLLPAEKGILYTVLHGGDLALADIVVLDLASKKVRVLVRGVYARYVSGGYLAYATPAGELLVVGFDERSLAIHGTPTLVAPGVSIGENGVAHVAVSRSGSLLYGVGGNTRREEVAWVDRKGVAQPFDSTLRGPFEDLALSADGKHLAITQDQKTADVWTKELEHGPISKVSLLGGNNWAPAWSKDGRFITFMHADDAVASLWKASADGSGQPIKLVEPKARLNYGFASADGQWLIYQTATGRERTSTLIAQRVSDTATIVISDGTVTMINPRLSPDGHWLAYALAGAGTAEVVVSPFPNVNASRAQVSVNGGILPVWSPTGTELFYRTSIQSSAAMLIAARIETSPTFRVIERTPLFNVSQFNGINGQGNSYDVSPDGTRFVMTRAIGDRAIRLMLVEHWATELAGMGARQ